MNIDQLNRLRRKREFYRDCAPDWCRNLWPRPQSFENFCKQYREPLKQADVLVRIGRDYFCDSERFADVAASILGLDGRES